MGVSPETGGHLVRRADLERDAGTVEQRNGSCRNLHCPMRIRVAVEDRLPQRLCCRSPKFVVCQVLVEKSTLVGGIGVGRQGSVEQFSRTDFVVGEDKRTCGRCIKDAGVDGTVRQCWSRGFVDDDL